MDLSRPKPTLAPHLLKNETSTSVDDNIMNVVPLVIMVLKDKRLRTEKDTRAVSNLAAKGTSSYHTKILEQILTLRDSGSHNLRGQSFSGFTTSDAQTNSRTVTALWNEAQTALLDLMSLEVFVGSLPELFERTSPLVCMFSSS